MTFQRTIQISSLALFLFLIFSAAFSVVDALPLDFFLRLDPSLVLITVLSSRNYLLAFLPTAILLLLSPLFGRLFCGYICPMGTTLDGADWVFKAHRKNGNQSGRLRSLKYLLVLFLIGASIFGVSFVFLASPLSLITRFYGLMIHPLLAFLLDGSLRIIRPLSEWMDVNTFLLAQIKTPRFATQFFLLAFFISLFALARLSPRFWCRNLCPSGALLALLSRKSVIRRQVSDECTSCGLCVNVCPMNAVDSEEPGRTRHEECLMCQSCSRICPVNAISFSCRPRTGPGDPSRISASRRQFIAAGLCGAATAAVTLTGLQTSYGKEGPGRVAPAGLLRPPGSLPEFSFLSRCVRCGECMTACPTNTLQPIWFKAGIQGLFSPAITPRRGVCNPECRNCGTVCPTGAISKLTKKERVWAKTGTAVIFRQKCLAWEHRKSCMVCDEVCPFKAVEFIKEPGNPVPVPQVVEEKCAGCGSCEYYCPVQNEAAIVVTPMGALRLAKGSHSEQGRRQGLRLSLKPAADRGPAPKEAAPQTGTAPGFTE
ncbi:MAG: 4Fe-4S binding protein [Pseudomonadota bacterium]